ncbi:type III pantothenate kinase [Aerosticca soli]|uniref:type III pantothenate kinase n=1 Tax=Aerosticca soli TaxID=2010829 RepID=UPI000F844049|nr:type III pantothenate kinase [Aerosticca soli]
MRLLLDLGNTRLKWALQDDAARDWLARGTAAWEAGMEGVLAEAWRGRPAVSQVLGASVVDVGREAQIARCVTQIFGRTPSWVRTPATAGGVRNGYAEPARLGVDRFLAMLAAHADALGDCILVGVGTALTLDALTAGGEHLGGLIAPGPQLMQRSLLGATARVRPQGPGRVVEAADNTADAVTSGCWLAAAALVERFAARMSARLGGAALVAIDGGDADALIRLLPGPVRRRHDSVLHGLAVWARAVGDAR